MKQHKYDLVEYLCVNLSELIILERLNAPSESSVEIKKEQILYYLKNAEGNWITAFNNKKLSSIAAKITDNEFKHILEEIRAHEKDDSLGS